MMDAGNTTDFETSSLYQPTELFQKLGLFMYLSRWVGVMFDAQQYFIRNPTTLKNLIGAVVDWESNGLIPIKSLE